MGGRPQNGYFNAAGKKVPGTTDITGRYKDSRGLMNWAHRRGLEGNPQLYDGEATERGTTVHEMAEESFRGKPYEALAAFAHSRARSEDDYVKAMAAYRAFEDWRNLFGDMHVIRPVAQEISLVSEKFQFGGTIDMVAMIGNRRAIIDFTTGS